MVPHIHWITKCAHTLSGLLEEGISIRAADMPGADDLMMRVYAAMARKERELISERTRAALAAARGRGGGTGWGSRVEAACSTLCRRSRSGAIGGGDPHSTLARAGTGGTPSRRDHHPPGLGTRADEARHTNAAGRNGRIRLWRGLSNGSGHSCQSASPSLIRCLYVLLWPAAKRGLRSAVQAMRHSHGRQGRHGWTAGWRARILPQNT
ncbi:recombinase family protein [Muricoccus aerilatus]|uniref:recombinase family protein n=1 Tax=Muricoccus aerilatus TaxID=452982 RepID=UPI001B80CD45|nr:recombinase family protein [Roseomonas aerilata]